VRHPQGFGVSASLVRDQEVGGSNPLAPTIFQGFKLRGSEGMSPPQRTGAFCRIPGVLGSTRPNQFLQSQRTVRESVSQLRPVPSGLRVQKSVSGGNTSVYIFSGSKVIAEYDNGAAPANPSREYIYSGGTLLAKVDSTGTYYYHQDHLSNRVVTDASGNVLAELGHFPFGESWYNGSGDKLMFTTYERDAETGNDYAQARQYVNGIARFSSLDPLSGDISDPQSLNRYSYVRNMPVMMVDPTGMWTCLPAASNTDDKQWAEGDFKEYLVSEEEADPPQNSCSYGWGLGGGGVGLDGVDITDYSGGGMGYFPLNSGSGVGESIIAATTPMNVGGWYSENGDWTHVVVDFVFLGYFSMGGQADGRGGGGGEVPGGAPCSGLLAASNPLCSPPPKPANYDECVALERQDPARYAFVGANLPAATNIAANLNTNVAYILGLSSLESSDGRSTIALTHGNFFGLTVGTQFTGTTGPPYVTSDGRRFGTYSTGFAGSGASFAGSTHGSRVSGALSPAAFAAGLTHGTPRLGAFNSQSGYAGELTARIASITPFIPCF